MMRCKGGVMMKEGRNEENEGGFGVALDLSFNSA